MRPSFRRASQAYQLICNVVIYVGMLLGLFQRRNLRVRALSVLSLIWFAYISVVHAALCGAYYLVPILAVLITSGYSGWAVYIKAKLREPGSMLSKTVQMYNSHAGTKKQL